jgi:2',3'-cyclic-nucleotide 2'-phosphodiesterase (5'-nucleotidase family)
MDRLKGNQAKSFRAEGPPARPWRALALRAALGTAFVCAALAACERVGGQRPAPADMGTSDAPAVPPAVREPSPAAARREIAVAATGDLNGWLVRSLVFPKERRGLAHLAPLIARLRAEHPALILLDGGDALAGAPEAARRWGERAESSGGDGAREPPAMVRAMNWLGYDAAVPGNRDLGLGPAAFREALAAAAFPWLAANASLDGARPAPFRPYVVLERDGVRVAVLGLTTPGLPMWVLPAERAGLRVSDLEEAAARWLPVLREAERADLVIALVHSGLDGDYEREEAVAAGLPLPNAAGRLADTMPGFDLIVSASAHRLAPLQPEPGGGDYAVPLIETGSRGNGLALALFRLERRGERWVNLGVTRQTLRAEPLADPALLAPTAESLAADRAWLEAPTAARFRAVPNPRDFFRCAGALQHTAVWDLRPPLAGGKGEHRLTLRPPYPRGAGEPGHSPWTAVPPGAGDRHPSLFHGEQTGEEVFTLLPMLWREQLPTVEEIGRPVRRLHLFRWMPYEDRPVQAALSGRQIAILLEPYVRWRRGLVVPPGEVLHPGGLTPFWEPRGGEALAVAVGHWPHSTQPPPGDAPLLEPHRSYPVWLTAYHWSGGGGLASQALLHPSQLRAETHTNLREAVFELLSVTEVELPKECQRWLSVVHLIP